MKLKLLILGLFCFSFSHLYSDWVLLNSYPSTLVNDILISGGTIYTTSTSGVHISTDGTVSWQSINNGLNTPQAIRCSQVLISGNNMYVSTEDGIYKSIDGGANWVRKSNGIFVGNGALYAFCESVFEINGMLLTGAYTGIYRSTNSGENWIATNITGMHIWAKNFTLYNNVLYAARESGNIPGSYKSTDNGVTFSPFSISGSNLPAITFYNDGPRLYAGTIFGVYLTTNSGASWVQKNTGLTPDPYSSSILRINGVLITSLKFGGCGMFISYNNGDQWIDFGQGLPFLTEINKVVQFNTKILIGTSNGIYQRNVSELTGINPVSNEIPGRFELYQNYPNPFNPETKIKFNIPLLRGMSEGRGVLTSLSIYNILGEEVDILVNQELQPGIYEVKFDGTNLPSSVYYYSLQAGDFKETKKMILIK
ncbi:MAG TPA: T9SS type A sorting domain-containing protein [Ignavibacteria bacterium]|nr:T9SS type A sorting domain-containing protein [Ignavibacteria bacterium]